MSIPGHLNLYAYCGNNPVMYTDSTGEMVRPVTFFEKFIQFLSNAVNEIKQLWWEINNLAIDDFVRKQYNNRLDTYEQIEEKGIMVFVSGVLFVFNYPYVSGYMLIMEVLSTIRRVMKEKNKEQDDENEKNKAFTKHLFKPNDFWMLYYTRIS